MNVRALLDRWTEAPSRQLTTRKYLVRLPVGDAGRIAALAELHPSRIKTEIITDLISAALNELETKIPYVPDDTVLAEDDHGDSIFAPGRVRAFRPSLGSTPGGSRPKPRRRNRRTERSSGPITNNSQLPCCTDRGRRDCGAHSTADPRRSSLQPDLTLLRKTT